MQPHPNKREQDKYGYNQNAAYYRFFDFAIYQLQHDFFLVALRLPYVGKGPPDLIQVSWRHENQCTTGTEEDK